MRARTPGARRHELVADPLMTATWSCAMAPRGSRSCSTRHSSSAPDVRAIRPQTPCALPAAHVELEREQGYEESDDAGDDHVGEGRRGVDVLPRAQRRE